MSYYTIREAATVLGVSVRTTRDYLKTGRLVGSRLSPKVVRITQESIDAFLDSCRSDRTPGPFLDAQGDAYLPQPYAVKATSDAA